jgi:hypothetical protein
MRLWMSGETAFEAGEAFREAWPPIEEAVNRVLADRDVQANVDTWVFIAILRPENLALPERARLDRRDRIVEFRYRIPYDAFVAAPLAARRGMLLTSLARSLGEMARLGVTGVPAGIQEALEAERAAHGWAAA